jgi:hypothetical protein
VPLIQVCTIRVLSWKGSPLQMAKSAISPGASPPAPGVCRDAAAVTVAARTASLGVMASSG